MGHLDQHIRHLAAQGVKIHIWPCAAGYQANVQETGADGWTCHTATDPVDALGTALRQRAARVPDRPVVAAPDEVQLELEDAIRQAAAAPDPFADLFD